MNSFLPSGCQGPDASFMTGTEGVGEEGGFEVEEITVGNWFFHPKVGSNFCGFVYFGEALVKRVFGGSSSRTNLECPPRNKVPFVDQIDVEGLV